MPSRSVRRAPDNPQQSEAAPAPADAPGSLDETKIAALKETLAAGERNRSGWGTSGCGIRASDPGGFAGCRCDSPNRQPSLPFTIEALPRARPASAKSDRSVIKKRLQARRAAQRRRIARSARGWRNRRSCSSNCPTRSLSLDATAARPMPQRAIR